MNRDSGIEFQLEGKEFIELCQLLKRVGLCENGGHAKAVISDGLVQVDGEVDLRKRLKVRAGQVVNFEGESIHVIE